MHPDRVVVLVGAGLSAASGIPTFRGPDGLWEGHEVTRVATPEAWWADPPLVRRFYDERRLHVATCRPNAGHEALARWQEAWGPSRVVIVSQNIDGLIQAAGAPEVLDLHGSLHRLRCERDEAHPTVAVAGRQDPDATCAVCGARLRPDVVWFGEVPRFLDRIEEAVLRADTFVAVGTSGLVYPAAGFGRVAHRVGAHTVEVNPEPSGAPWFAEVVAEGSETALPRLVDAWVAGSAARR
ncbi:MAG: NAD-dependent deacylase [Alphaproteobacteria bacterium]|nr:NAD-dependent deacylase [Alphaproteobacteria bacterium]